MPSWHACPYCGAEVWEVPGSSTNARCSSCGTDNIPNANTPVDTQDTAPSPETIEEPNGSLQSESQY